MGLSRSLEGTAERRRRTARVRQHRIAESNEIRACCAKVSDLLDSLRPGYARNFKQLRPPCNPLDDGCERRPPAVFVRLAEHHIVGSRLARGPCIHTADAD